MFQHRLVGADMHAVHTPGLEAVVSARSRANGPQADPPVHTADVTPAVLGAQWPVGRREGGMTCHHVAQRAPHTAPGVMQALGTASLAFPKHSLIREPYGSGLQWVQGEETALH